MSPLKKSASRELAPTQRGQARIDCSGNYIEPSPFDFSQGLAAPTAPSPGLSELVATSADVVNNRGQTTFPHCAGNRVERRQTTVLK